MHRLRSRDRDASASAAAREHTPRLSRLPRPRWREAGVEGAPRSRTQLPWTGKLRALAADAAGELDVLGHDGHALGVDRAQVGVLEEADEVGLRRLLQRDDCRLLEAEVRLEVLRDLADEALEGQLADEQLGRLLVAADLAQRDRARAVAVRLLHAARGRRRLARGLGRELLAGRLAAGRLARGLLGACHGSRMRKCHWS
mmetsp:Transcript_39451/g.97404  ORF Transcript_39451/g.97404 Transcript_39451/m.97404 type:complete len:200 (+) Transcript_39451:214-813(+)